MALVSDGRPELPLIAFRDEYGTGRLNAEGKPIGGRSAESAAAAFYLEHRQGPRRHSITDMDPKHRQPGRAIGHVDVEGTVDAIERAAEIITVAWRGPVLVLIGWRVRMAELRSDTPSDGGLPYLARAGFPVQLPQGFESRGVAHWARHFREELIRFGLVVRPQLDEGPAAPRAVVFVPDEDPIVGWKAIGARLGVSEDTAQRWCREFGLPVRRMGRGCSVRIYPSELAHWEASGVAAA